MMIMMKTFERVIVVVVYKMMRLVRLSCPKLNKKILSGSFSAFGCHQVKTIDTLTLQTGLLVNTTNPTYKHCTTITASSFFHIQIKSLDSKDSSADFKVST